MFRMTPLSVLILLTGAAGCDLRETDAPTVEEEGELSEVEEEQAPEEARDVVYEFHQALEAGDSTRALALLHPDAVIHEAGHSETVGEYREGHLAADADFAAAVSREILHEEVLPLGDATLYLAETRASGTLRGREIDSRGTETVLLTRTDEPDEGAWRIRHVHWSSR